MFGMEISSNRRWPGSARGREAALAPSGGCLKAIKHRGPVLVSLQLSLRCLHVLLIKSSFAAASRQLPRPS